ncbi:MAG: hypothetical protein AB7H90_18365 [Alphaproteobacteria bacterium]
MASIDGFGAASRLFLLLLAATSSPKVLDCKEPSQAGRGACLDPTATGKLDLHEAAFTPAYRTVAADADQAGAGGVIGAVIEIEGSPALAQRPSNRAEGRAK